MIFAFVMVFSVLAQTSVNASSDSYVRITGDTWATVLQVIDGDALRVQIWGSDDVALVRLAGVDTMGRTDARDFMAGALLGRAVELVVSAAQVGDARFDDRWTAVYLIHERNVYNRALVMRGLAQVDRVFYQDHWLWSSLLMDENRARAARLGMWTPDGFRATAGGHQRRWWGYTGERVNINTATASQINRVLTNAEIQIGSSVVRYRNHSPFQRVEDIKFIDTRVSRRDFDNYAHLFKVSTNINTATQDELTQLLGVNTNIAREIIRARERAWFTDIYQLRTQNLVTQSVFEQNRQFISTYDVEEIVAATPDIIVDVNTATASELQEAGLTSAQATAIVNSRGNGYTIKSMGEIAQVSGVTLSERRIHELADNIRVNVDSPHHVQPRRININTATQQELFRVGFNNQQVGAIMGRRGRMNSGSDLPFNVSEFDQYITLFTNVNTAMADEWMSLSEDIPLSFASRLEQETRSQPFGTLNELRDFFEDHGFEDEFLRIRRFLILR